MYISRCVSRVRACTLSIIIILLSGCVDLSGIQYKSPPKVGQQKAIATKKVPKGTVYTMRGGLGIFSIGMNQLRDTVDARYPVSAQSLMWYRSGDVSRAIIRDYNREKEHGPIILIGHSLGANEQIQVARALNNANIPVALLVTVDAVSQTVVPPNVHHALNLYKPGFVPMFSGLKLRAVDSRTTQIDNINVTTLKGINVNHFTIDKDKVVQNMILDKVDKVLNHGTKHAA